MSKKMTLQEASDFLLAKQNEIEAQLDKIFYYAEGEDLLKVDQGGWNVIEVFYHINLLNESYLDQFEGLLNKAQSAEGKRLKRSWLGRKLEDSSRISASATTNKKYTSPKKIDPKEKQKQGFAVVEKVVFQELLRDLKEIKRYSKLLAEKDLTSLKVKTVFPILKVNMADALFIMLRHTERHIAQAERILKS